MCELASACSCVRSGEVSEDSGKYTEPCVEWGNSGGYRHSFHTVHDAPNATTEAAAHTEAAMLLPLDGISSGAHPLEGAFSSNKSRRMRHILV